MKKILNTLISFAVSFPVPAVFAQTQPGGQGEPKKIDPLANLIEVGGQAGFGKVPRPIELIIADIVRVILSFLGLIFVLLIIWSGFQWMTSGGNEKLLTEAKNRIKNATVGLVIVLAAYAIAYWITSWLEVAVMGAPGGDATGGP